MSKRLCVKAVVCKSVYVVKDLRVKVFVCNSVCVCVKASAFKRVCV